MREVVQKTAEVSLSDRILWMTIGLFVLGTIGRNLLSQEPFQLKRFLGELVMSVLGGFIIWSFGLMKGMTPSQMVFFGGFAAWGGIRAMEWCMKIFYTMIAREAKIRLNGDK